MTAHKVHNVLFICSHNSARSILAEAIVNATSAGRFRGHSAGSHPAGQVHPMALELLQRNHYRTEGLRSKGWDEFAQPGAPVMDFVFTVCDQAAGEVCPVWPGQPITAHWGVADPAQASGTEAARMHAFMETFLVMQRRISLFQCLPIDKLGRLALQREVEQIGRSLHAAA